MIFSPIGASFIGSDRAGKRAELPENWHCATEKSAIVLWQSGRVTGKSIEIGISQRSK